MGRKTALIYVRRSFIRKGEEAISPAKQEDNCRRISEELGWVPEFYRDAEEGRHFSATSEMGRPAWLRLKRQLGRPDVVAVVVDSLDRAYRSLRDFLDFLALIDKYHVRFISHRETIDTESVMGQALLKMMMVFFELEAEMTGQRTMEAIQHRREKGVHCGSTPFGLDRREDGVFIADEDLPTVLLLFELYATGKESYPSVAEKLNLMGRRFRDHSGHQKPFNRESVRSIIGRVLIYLGYIPLNRGGKDQPPIGEGDLVDQLIYQVDAVPGQHEAFISRELANRVLAAKRARFKAKRRQARVYLLTGILHCDHCKGPMRGFRARWGYRGYQYRHSDKVCRPRWMSLDADALEAQVIDLLQALELPPQLQEAIKARARAQGGLVPGKDEAHQAIARLQGKLARLREMRLEGEYSKEEYAVRKRQLLQELQRWEQARPDYSPDRTLLDLNNVAEILRQGPPVAKKRAIHSIFERIEVNGEGVITKAVPRQWCRPLFVTLQSVICDMDGARGSPVPHYVAKLGALLATIPVCQTVEQPES